MLDISNNKCSGLPFTGLGVCDEEGRLRLGDCIHYRWTRWRWCAMIPNLDAMLRHRT
jgi:hypothetical protein